MLIINPTDLPGNVHEVSPGDPQRVIRAQLYRMSWADVVELGDPRFDALAEAFPEPYRPARTTGFAGIESQEHSILWIGDPGVITRFRHDPRHVVPWAELGEHGTWSDGWPRTAAWLRYIPDGTWCPGGQGVVAEYGDSGNAAVTVYEKLARPAYPSAGRGKEDPPGLIPVVTFHCGRCHGEAGAGDWYPSAGPEDRQAACRDARSHISKWWPGHCQSQPATVRGDDVTAATSSAIAIKGGHASTSRRLTASCQGSIPDPGDGAGSTCGEVRQAREHTRHARQLEGTRPR